MFGGAGNDLLRGGSGNDISTVATAWIGRCSTEISPNSPSPEMR
ncbi:hypothetical protein [Salmonella sp. SAL4449]